MSVDTQMVIKSIAVFIAGVLVATGHLNAANSDAFVNDATAFGGLAIAVVGAFYLCEHALVKVKDDLLYTTEETPPTDNTQTTETTPSATPAQPAA